MSRVLFSHQSDEWATPQWLFDELDHEFHFTVDAAANELNTKCARFYSITDNSLDHDWANERVYCNPPYSMVNIFVEKAYNTTGKDTIIVLLLPARTDTQWFHKYVYNKAEIRFIKGRLKFSGARYNAPFPSMIVVYRGGGKPKVEK